MRTLRPAVTIIAVAIFLVFSGVAVAGSSSGGHKGGYYRGGGKYYRSGYYGGHYRGRTSISIGWPYWGPWGYYPYYYPYYAYPYYGYPYYYPYYAPAVTGPTSPPEYIEKSKPAEESAPSGVWYYCPDSKAYYPYVMECPGGWQTVPAQPSSEPRR